MMQTLRLKPKHLTSIFTLLSVILLLSNIQFVEADVRGMLASVANVHILEHVAQLLGMLPNDLAQMLMNQTNYIHKKTYTFFFFEYKTEHGAIRPIYSGSVCHSTLVHRQNCQPQDLPCCYRGNCSNHYSNHYSQSAWV